MAEPRHGRLDLDIYMQLLLVIYWILSTLVQLRHGDLRLAEDNPCGLGHVPCHRAILFLMSRVKW